MKFKIGELRHPEVVKLLHEHHQDMLSLSPPDSVHALDLTALEMPNITFVSAWIDNRLAGVGALKELDNGHGEIKSMRTSKAFLRQGIAANILNFIIEQATTRSYHRLSLETGTMEAFKPAHKLYLSFGFTECPPFGTYQVDPHSLFMTKVL